MVLKGKGHGSYIKHEGFRDIVFFFLDRWHWGLSLPPSPFPLHSECSGLPRGILLALKRG